MRIGLCGAQGTGKTTLVDLFLQQHDNYIEPDNISRLFNKKFKNFGINKDGNVYTQSLITGFVAYSMMVNRNIIHARTIVDTFAYARKSDDMTQEDCDGIENIYKSDIANIYDVIFYVPIEFVPPEDGVRVTDEEYRHEIDDFIVNFLKDNNIEHYVLTGSIEERYNRMTEVIKQKEKIC